MPLTPNNREESWLKGMVDGSTTLTPNKRREYWYKEIIDAQGGGGGGGVLVVEVSESDNVFTMDTTAGEVYTAAQTGMVILSYNDKFRILTAADYSAKGGYEFAFSDDIGTWNPGVFSASTASDYPSAMGAD